MNQTTQRLQLGFNKLINVFGNQISVKYYSQTLGSIYDEPDQITQSGATVWGSGAIVPLDKSSDDLVLLEQGKIGYDDMIMFVNGSLSLGPIGGSITQVKIGVGSPSTNFYQLVQEGTNQWFNEDIPVYKKVYVRRLTGSLYGE